MLSGESGFLPLHRRQTMDSSLLTPDYVIIGAGICGMVLAARLSEDPNISVGVLEAGGDVFHDENIDTPGTFSFFACGFFHPNLFFQSIYRA